MTAGPNGSAIGVPRALLARTLAEGPATPLAPTARRFFEARFGANLSDVRIHTGGAAARLCRALGARALTLGPDIVFADEAYAPETPGGRRLLAHELVHVLQQRAAGAQPACRTAAGIVPVGAAADACEDEADRLAARVIRGGAICAVTPDRSGAIRRAITVLDATASMTVGYTNTRPGLDYVQRGASDFSRMAVLHLSRNKGPVVRGQIESPTQASAIRITGTVMLQADAKATEADIKAAWSFRFIQLFYDKIEQASYAGRAKADGSIWLNLAGPQHFRGYASYLIDSDPDDSDKMPYADIWVGLERGAPHTGLWQAKVINDDHPHADRPLVLQNSAAGGKRNYLYRVARQYHVLTALVAVDRNTGVIRPLAHVEWDSWYTARLPWRANSGGGVEVGIPQEVQSQFSVGQVTQGAPADKDAADMIRNASSAAAGDMYNAAIKDAFRAVILTGRKGSDVDISAQWTPSVPADHFA